MSPQNRLGSGGLSRLLRVGGVVVGAVSCLPMIAMLPSAIGALLAGGNRSTSGPATGANNSTGAISAITTPDTPTPEPVSSKTSNATVVNCAMSPAWLTVRAAHSRR